MKTLIKILILLVLFGCGEKTPKPEKYYLFETADYVDFDDSCRVIYVKSHRQLQESDEFYMIGRVPNEYSRVYNALGHAVSRNYSSPKIAVDTLDPFYDITIHMHSPADSILSITSAVEFKNLGLTRYYMPEVCRVDNFEGLYNYTIRLINYDNIDFKNGERVVLEYSDYKIPIPYQIFIL